MTGAANHRGTSRQDYETPWSLITAVERLLGWPIVIDLAASQRNTKCHERWIGEDADSLTIDWAQRMREIGSPGGFAWLNPPFASIAPWAKKCALESAKGARIAFLVPASVGSNWWRDNVHRKARVCFLNGRVSFDGKHPFPKDLALCVYGVPWGYDVWDWRAELRVTLPEIRV